MPSRKKKVRKVGANCRWSTLAKIDGRTKEAAILRRVRIYLKEFVGDSPTIAQALLIERAAWLTLRLALIERKMAEGDLTEFDSLHYLAWSNTLAKTLGRLGIDSPSIDTAEDNEPEANLAEYLSRRAPADDTAPDPVEAA